MGICFPSVKRDFNIMNNIIFAFFCITLATQQFLVATGQPESPENQTVSVVPQAPTPASFDPWNWFAQQNIQTSQDPLPGFTFCKRENGELRGEIWIAGTIEERNGRTVHSTFNSLTPIFLIQNDAGRYDVLVPRFLEGSSFHEGAQAALTASFRETAESHDTAWATFQKSNETPLLSEKRVFTHTTNTTLVQLTNFMRVAKHKMTLPIHRYHH